MNLEFKVRAKIQRPVTEVFAAVQKPENLTRYFATGSSSGPLLEGTTVMWTFADCPGEYPVKVGRVVPNELIAFEWQAGDGEYDTAVEMRFEPLDKDSTLVTITESGWKETPEGLKSSYGNCEGWTNMACCLKAWIEHGINLRDKYY